MMNYIPKGWIKLPRDLECQDVFRDSDTLRLFLHLVCRAVTEPVLFRGIQINRGQLAVTYPYLSNALRISNKRVRTIIGALKRTGMLYVKRVYGNSHGFSIVTICNYDNYHTPFPNRKMPFGQSNLQINAQDNGRIPPVYTLYNEKELYKKIIEEGNSSSSPSFEKLLIEKLIEDDAWKTKVTEIFGLDEKDLIKRLDEFFISNESRGKYHSDISDLKSHFVNWLQIILNSKNKTCYNNEKIEAGRFDKRRGMDPGICSAEDYEGPF